MPSPPPSLRRRNASLLLLSVVTLTSARLPPQQATRMPVCRHIDASMQCFVIHPDHDASAPGGDVLTWLRVRCPRHGQNVPDDSGGWTLNEAYTYKLDRRVLREYTRLFAGATVTELGAGKGCYTKALLATKRVKAVRAFDGARNIASLTDGLVQFADLSKPGHLESMDGAGPNRAARREDGHGDSSSDWALSTEVGEHIPPSGEAAYLDHVASYATRGAVLSWAVPEQGGTGHVNLLTNAQVAGKMAARGLCLDVTSSIQLRRAAFGGKHFRATIAVYRRHCAQGQAPCCPWHGARVSALATTMATLDGLGLQPWPTPFPMRRRVWCNRAAVLVLAIGLLAACVVVACRRWQRAQEEVRDEDVFKRLQGRRSLGSEYKQSLRDGGSCSLSLGE